MFICLSSLARFEHYYVFLFVSLTYMHLDGEGCYLSTCLSMMPFVYLRTCAHLIFLYLSLKLFQCFNQLGIPTYHVYLNVNTTLSTFYVQSIYLVLIFRLTVQKLLFQVPLVCIFIRLLKTKITLVRCRPSPTFEALNFTITTTSSPYSNTKLQSNI